jgi:hypothetical protein
MQWEYRKLNLNDLPRKTDDVDLLNGAGEDNWELVQITANNIAYLRRPMKPEATSRKGKTPKA